MSKHRRAGFQSIRYWILCVLLAAGLALAGCGAKEAPAGEDALREDEQAEQEVNSGQVMLPSAAEVIAEAGMEASEEVSEEDQFAGDEGDDPLGGQGAAENPDIAENPDAVANPGTAVNPGAAVNPAAGPVGAGTKPTLKDLLISADLEGKPAVKRRVLPEIYDPNQTYDIYSLVEYSIDDIGYEFTATVSAEYDFSEYEVHCTVGRTEQLVILDMYYNVIYDRTGSMGDDAQAIVQMAVEANEWMNIGD